MCVCVCVSFGSFSCDRPLSHIASAPNSTHCGFISHLTADGKVEGEKEGVEEWKRSGEKVQQDSKVERQGGLREVTGGANEKGGWGGEGKAEMDGKESKEKRTRTYLHETALVSAPATTSSFIIKHIWDGDTWVDVAASHRWSFTHDCLCNRCRGRPNSGEGEGRPTHNQTDGECLVDHKLTLD